MMRLIEALCETESAEDLVGSAGHSVGEYEAASALLTLLSPPNTAIMREVRHTAPNAIMSVQQPPVKRQSNEKRKADDDIGVEKPPAKRRLKTPSAVAIELAPPGDEMKPTSSEDEPAFPLPPAFDMGISQDKLESVLIGLGVKIHLQGKAIIPPDGVKQLHRLVYGLITRHTHGMNQEALSMKRFGQLGIKIPQWYINSQEAQVIVEFVEWYEASQKPKLMKHLKSDPILKQFVETHGIRTRRSA